MKTILIIHTENASRRKHFATAKTYGARLVLLKKNPTWENDFVDRSIDVDTRSIDKTVKAALKLQQTEKIDGIITFVEHSVPTAAAVAKALKLPYISEEAAYKARDKYAMRCAFFEKNIPCPFFELAHNLHEAKQIGKKCGYPIVLKPLIGGGSMYIRRVNTPKELEEHFSTIQQGAWAGFDYDPLYEKTKRTYQNAILIESYVEGGEVSIESLIQNGKTVPLAIHDKPLPMQGPYFEEIYFTTPSRQPRNLQTQLKKLTCQANEALGIDIGASHTEFRISAKGPIILETAARIGGGPVYRSVLTSTGIDMVHGIMDLSLGKKIDLKAAKQNPTGFYLFFAEQEGILRRISGIEQAATQQGVVEVELYKQIGDLLLRAPKTFQSHGHFIANAETFDLLDRRIKTVTQTIRLEVDCV